MPARGQPEKREEARRLVEEEGLSLAEAADRVGANRGTVREWQKQDEKAGDGWTLLAERSAAQKAKADALTDEQRAAQAERARRASLAWGEARRREESAAASVAAMQLRTQMQNTLPRFAASLLEGGTDGDTGGLRPQRLANAIKSLVVSYAVAIDKADRLAGVDNAALVEEAVADPLGDVEAAVTLLASVRERRASA